MNFFSKAIVSLLGVGFIRPASATWGSFAAALILYPWWPSLDPQNKVFFIVVIFCIGWVLSEWIEKNTKTHDPHFIVIDEAVGMMICTSMLGQQWVYWVGAFFLFRFFDIAKLWPASIFDKRPGGFSIMFDDVLMALPPLLILWLLL